MKPAGCEADLLRALASMPFLDRLEMVAVCGWSRGAVYEAIASLESGGFCASVPHAVDPLPPARRFHLTAAGLRRLAGEEGVALDELVRSHPVSAQWRRILMDRLDPLASVYHVASALSNVAYPIRFRWYRAMPMDAAMTLPDGRTVGIIRQGLTADRSGFSKRLWRLRDWPLPGTASSSSWPTTCGSGTPAGSSRPPTCRPCSPWNARRSWPERATGYGAPSRSPPPSTCATSSTGRSLGASCRGSLNRSGPTSPPTFPTGGRRRTYPTICCPSSSSPPRSAPST